MHRAQPSDSIVMVTFRLQHSASIKSVSKRLPAE